MIWKIPVRWEMTGLQAVEAGTLEEAIKCSCNEFNATDGEFVDGTLELDCDDIDIIRQVYNRGLPDGFDGMFPELLKYELYYEQNLQARMRRYIGSDDGIYGMEISTYEIIFEVCNERYYCCIEAHSVHEAIGIFFEEHPHITYSMIVDHVEV